MIAVHTGRGRSTALVPAALLLAGGAVVAVGALTGTAHTYDGSPLGSVHAAVWVILLPAVVALLVAPRRPLLGLGICAGAGVAAVGRVVSDLGLLTDPNAAVRPELFYELTTRAQPFTAAAGTGVLVAGDVLLVVAGLLAARSLADRLALGATPIFDAPIFDPPTSAGAAGADPGERGSGGAMSSTRAATASTGGAASGAGGSTADDSSSGADAEPTPTERGPELLVEAWAAEAATPITDVAGGSTSRQRSDAADRGRNNGLIVAGFVGVLLLLAGSLGLPYSGGYLAGRYLPAELGLAGIGSALAVALVATIAVLVAAVLPRRLSAALLAGVALLAAVPLLTAVVVRLANAPVLLTASVWVGLGGAVVLAAAGLLGHAAPLADDVDDYDVPSTAAVRRTGWIGTGVSLLAALAGFAAWRLPQLRYNGGPDPVLPGGYAISAPLAAPFLLAAIVPAAGAVLWLVPALAAAGRALMTVGWLPLVFATTQTLYLLGQLVSSASVPNAGFAAPRWTAGPGLWWAVGGILTGIGAAVVSVVAARQARDASTLLAQEESLARSRRTGALVATVLSVVAVCSLALPVYRTGAGSSATLLVGFDVRSWGVLGLAAGMVTAAVAGARSLRPSAAVGFLLAGAALAVERLVIPAPVRAADGFSVGAGWYAGWVAVALSVVAAVLLALGTRRIVLLDAGGARVGGGAERQRVGAKRSTRTGPDASKVAGRPGPRPAGKGSASKGSASRSAPGKASSSGTKGRP